VLCTKINPVRHTARYLLLRRRSSVDSKYSFPPMKGRERNDFESLPAQASLLTGVRYFSLEGGRYSTGKSLSLVGVPMVVQALLSMAVWSSAPSVSRTGFVNLLEQAVSA